MLVVGGVRNHAPAEAAALLVLLVAALAVGRWMARDLRAHPSNFPAPAASHGLRVAAAGADGRRERSPWASLNRTREEG